MYNNDRINEENRLFILYCRCKQAHNANSEGYELPGMYFNPSNVVQSFRSCNL